MKQKSLSSLKAKLWKLCREITDQRYPSICYTCHRPVEGKNKHLGHCIPSSIGGASLRYHLDNLRFQCYNCNINAGGNGALYVTELIRELGTKRVNAMLALKNKIIQADRYFYEQKIAEYQSIIKE